MARPRRLTREQGVAQDAVTASLQTAHAHREDERRYAACIDYAARTIDMTRRTVELVDRKTDRAWRD